jgi:uncharacterized protein YjbI with pentapeptide repeats
MPHRPDDESTRTPRNSNAAHPGASAGKAEDGSADASALMSAVNSASSGAAGLWLSFLTFMAYLTMTVGSVTHLDLLLAKPIKLPVLNVELPLVAFFWIAPLFFLLFHFYLFLQLVMLVRKVATFEEGLELSPLREEEREQYRKRLDSFLVVQFLFGAKEERNGTTGWLLRGVAFITLVICPILLLLQFQVTFVPYHDAWVTWTHRIAILVDVRLAWIFWCAIAQRRGAVLFPEFHWIWGVLSRPRTIRTALHGVGRKTLVAFNVALRHQLLGLSSAAIVLFLSMFVIAYKGEVIAGMAKVPYYGEGGLQSDTLAELLLHGSINMVEGRPRSFFSNVLVVPNRKIVATGAVDQDFPPISLRGRDLRGAVLIGSDLRGVDFTGANLSDARLDQARLMRAKFGCVQVSGRSTDGGRPSAKPNWPDDECTWLQRATFALAQLQDADFTNARMQGAILLSANLQAAKLNGALLQDAVLTKSELQGAQLRGTILTNAFLDGARLFGARIDAPQLNGALFDGGTGFGFVTLKVSWLEPVLIALGGGPPNDAGSNVDPSEKEVMETFKSAEISARTGDNPIADGVVDYDTAPLKKLRQVAVAILMAENKWDGGDPDFDRKRQSAVSKTWNQVQEILAKGPAKNEPQANGAGLAGFLRDLACDVGSNPYIAGGLVENERIGEAAARFPKEMAPVIEKLQKPDECPGAVGLKTIHKIYLGTLANSTKQNAGLVGGTKKAASSAEHTVGTSAPSGPPSDAPPPAERGPQ